MSTEVTQDTTLGEEDSSSPIFFASITERTLLNPGSDKKTYHIALNIEQSGITYNVGDCVGIYPQNNPHFVEKILKTLKLSGAELVVNRSGQEINIRTFLLNQANLNRIPKTLGANDFLNFLESTVLTPQELCTLLLPMLPRFYSIASAMSAVKNEIHLTVGLTQNEPDAFLPFGTCTHFLCYDAEMNVPCIPLFHKAAKHFSLLSESHAKPLIMIGPGTGIAPFRGFMQERVTRGHSPENWLFFGERYSKTDFYYSEFWQALEKQNNLKVSLAFSRDQNEKIYVQHRMLQHAEEFWNWMEKGAYIYVCGDAKNMAKDVDKTLHLIVEKEGKLEAAKVKEYIKNLKKIGRYQRDVY